MLLPAPRRGMAESFNIYTSARSASGDKDGRRGGSAAGTAAGFGVGKPTGFGVFVERSARPLDPHLLTGGSKC